MPPKSKKNTTVRRRRERKNIEKGQAHIRASFNNTIVTITDVNGNALHGPPPAALVSAALVSLPHLLHSPLPKLLQRMPWSMA